MVSGIILHLSHCFGAAWVSVTVYVATAAPQAAPRCAQHIDKAALQYIFKNRARIFSN